MNLSTLFFLVLSAVIIFSGIKFLLTNNTVHAVMFFFLALFSIALIIFMLYAPFVAAMQIMLYAGAITILILFVVMLTAGHVPEIKKQRPNVFFVVLFSSILFALISLTTFTVGFNTGKSPALDGANTVALGQILFRNYVYPFEIASILLLVAVIGALYLITDIVLKKKEGEVSG